MPFLVNTLNPRTLKHVPAMPDEESHGALDKFVFSSVLDSAAERVWIASEEEWKAEDTSCFIRIRAQQPTPSGRY